MAAHTRFTCLQTESQHLSKGDQLRYFTQLDHTSPIIQAATSGQFERLQQLLDEGVYIAKPHHLPCWCLVCRSASPEEQLERSRYRMEVYRALASPAWISLTADDPIFEAFELSEQLQMLSRIEVEFKDFYLELSKRCQNYTCDLLNLCEATEEVIIVLNRNNDDPIDKPLNKKNKLELERLKLAIKYKQKRFVAHPHCQQLLTSIWYEGFPGRQERGSMLNILVCMLLIIAWPLLAFCYIVAPKSRIGQIVRSPFMKFLYYSTSFGIFLCLLTVATVKNMNRSESELVSRSKMRGPYPTPVEWMIFVFVLGMVWAEVKQLWDEGFKLYILQWWNYLDYAMMSLYLSTFALRAIALYYDHTGKFGKYSVVSRDSWQTDEPLLISEGLFAVANVFSFARIIFLFQTNPYLGPLQISLGCMLLDIAKFFFIFFLILTSFAFGLHQLYWYYPKCPDSENSFGVETKSAGCKTNTGAFTTIEDSYLTLLWSLFSITSRKDTEVAEPHHFTEWIGRGLYISYHVTSIIVLLNMLIAMMSFSFQRINENSDLEWKFHRSKLWMSYFDEGSSLTAPFNIVVTPKSIIKFLSNIFRRFKKNCGGAEIVPISSKRGTIRRPGYNKKRWRNQKRPVSQEDDIPTYREIMERLVHRYIHMMKKEMKMDGVNEDDLLEIKQDISSLRFELREDRRREILRWSSQLDGTKKDIIRSLSIVHKDKPRATVSPSWKRSTTRESSSTLPIRGDQSFHSSTMSMMSPCPSPTSFFSPSIQEGKGIQSKSPSFASLETATLYKGEDEPPHKPTKKLSSVSFKETGDASPAGRRATMLQRGRSSAPGVTITFSPTDQRPSSTEKTAAVSMATQTETDLSLNRIDESSDIEVLRQKVLMLFDEHYAKSQDSPIRFANLPISPPSSRSLRLSPSRGSGKPPKPATTSESLSSRPPPSYWRADTSHSLNPHHVSFPPSPLNITTKEEQAAITAALLTDRESII